jgi:hypothetical protein
MSPDTATPPPLRVGLFIDSFDRPAWVFKVIQQIQSSSFAQVSLIIKNEATVEPQSRAKSYWKNRKYLLYAFYQRVDNFMVKVADDPFAQRDLRELIPGCPIISVQPVMTKHSDSFSEQDVRTISEYDLDVGLAFGFRILRGDILRIFKYGLWSYHHGDNLVNRGGPAGFWEVIEGSPVTGTVLQVLNEDLDNGKVIFRSWSSTVDRFSVKASRNHIYWRASSFVVRKLKQAYEQGSVDSPNEGLYRPYSNRLYRMPTNSELLGKLSKLSATYFKSKLQHAFYLDRWVLAYRFRQTDDDANNTLYRFKYLLPRPGCYWADPFPIKVDDKYYLFFEEFVNKQNKGQIAVVELSKSSVSEPVVALERDYHLSYPFVFKHHNQMMMIPETAANKQVEVYSATRFPDKWKLETVLMENISAKDVTLAQIDDLWWMFVAISEYPFADDLHLFYAESPYGPWRPHKLNPVKSDVRSSRPAGNIFEWNGDLYRPSQDSSRHYGYAITINRILRLTPHEFVEEEVSKILPQWGKNVLATHTLNICDDLTVVDCLLRTRRA